MFKLAIPRHDGGMLRANLPENSDEFRATHIKLVLPPLRGTERDIAAATPIRARYWAGFDEQYFRLKAILSVLIDEVVPWDECVAVDQKIRADMAADHASDWLEQDDDACWLSAAQWEIDNGEVGMTVAEFAENPEMTLEQAVRDCQALWAGDQSQD